ncbi:MAG: hypothetical protein ACTSWY_04225 [Promethearchaeota archaeon]
MVYSLMAIHEKDEKIPLNSNDWDFFKRSIDVGSGSCGIYDMEIFPEGSVLDSQKKKKFALENS